MRVECWALKTAQGLVKDFRDPLEGFKTMTFRTKKDAIAWAQTNKAYRAVPVKITILVSIKGL